MAQSRIRSARATIATAARFSRSFAHSAPILNQKLPTMAVEPPSAERSAELADNFNHILSQVNEAAAAHPAKSAPRLVAVSKLKPSADILALHSAGVRHFGENYPQELCDKAAELPVDIAWHFIGSLQSNKCKPLASIPNLYAIETLTSAKAADILQRTVAGLSPARADKLNVFIQVNTSNEDNKSGLAPSVASSSDGPSELVTLAAHVLSECAGLRLKGLMTIGSFGASHSEDELNPDFETLSKTATELVAELKKKLEAGESGLKVGVEELEREGLELSMGMSDDFVKAIKQGSSNVRVGSSIFGARPPRKP